MTLKYMTFSIVFGDMIVNIIIELLEKGMRTKTTQNLDYLIWD